MPDETYLNIYRLVRTSATTLTRRFRKVPRIRAGWYQGGRQLIDRDIVSPDAVYVVSSEGIERWPLKEVFCF